MKTFTNICAQGDVLIRRVAEMPGGVTEVSPEGGQIIVTHSETGHHHACTLERDPAPNVQMFAGDNPLIAWLKVNRPTALDHHRPHDTHESIMFSPGIYEIRRQREHSPEGWRRVQD